MIRATATASPTRFSNIQPIWKFCILYFVTSGFYAIAWHHKQWKLIQDRGRLKIHPWQRALLSGIYMYSLVRRISILADDKSFQEKLSPFRMTFLVILSFCLSRLPFPFSLLLFIDIIVYIKLSNAVNHWWRQEEGETLPERKSFTGRELLWLGFGAIFWILIILSSFQPGVPPIGTSVSPQPEITQPSQMGQVSLQEDISGIVAEINADLPTMLDDETRLDSAVGGDNLITYHFTLVNYSSSDIDSQLFHENVLPEIQSNICASPDVKKLLEKGLTLKHLYNGNDNRFVGEVITELADCY